MSLQWGEKWLSRSHLYTFNEANLQSENGEHRVKEKEDNKILKGDLMEDSLRVVWTIRLQLHDLEELKFEEYRNEINTILLYEDLQPYPLNEVKRTLQKIEKRIQSEWHQRRRNHGEENWLTRSARTRVVCANKSSRRSFTWSCSTIKSKESWISNSCPVVCISLCLKKWFCSSKYNSGAPIYLVQFKELYTVV